MPSTQELLRDYKLRPKKSWGQNFLSDGNALDRIVHACGLGEDDSVVVEIGAGLGALTQRLHEAGCSVLAIERDRDLVPVLKERFEPGSGVEIVEANALDFDLQETARRKGGRIKVIGNLPYQISAPILFKLLDNRQWVSSAHLLLQKEVALRLAASAGSKDYSLLSVLFSRVAEISRDTDVSRNCFVPVPKVDSSFVSLYFKTELPERPDDKLFKSFAKACFHQRRKTLSNSLRKQPFLKLSEEVLAKLKEAYPETLALRAETLEVSTFVEMALKVEDWSGQEASS